MTVMFNLSNNTEMDLTHNYICQNCMQNKKDSIYHWIKTLDNKTEIYICFECYKLLEKTILIK
jgi:protein-arginine kinase activator protein McsA